MEYRYSILNLIQYRYACIWSYNININIYMNMFMLILNK